uniref:Reverse transcriptase domain-containing protein n=1 Tax=Amphimedon queenslandica TaxID=400682 RepID=A0A1X7VK11_AMPQE
MVSVPSTSKTYFAPPVSVSPTVSPFFNSLTSFVSLVVNGAVPEEVRPLFFGARLTALSKKRGGVRPIAVGCTLRCLIAKVVSGLVSVEMSSLLAPRQLGYGIPGGVEATVHAACYFLRIMDDSSAFLKLDFCNAFNSIHRSKILAAVKQFAPTIFPYVLFCYSSPSSLFWEDYVIESGEGVRQGDPLGPLLFCPTIYEVTQSLKSQFCVLYLDDLSLGGNVETLMDDLQTILFLESYGLHLNTSKSEVSDLFTIGNRFLCVFQMSLGNKLHYHVVSAVPEVDSALSHWSDSLTPPVGDDALLQGVWDLPHIKSTLDSLLETDHAPTKACLYAVSTPESGAWLNALPLSAMGLQMDDATIRIAVGLRLGLPLGCPHSCHHCGSAVDDLATHGLHCKQSDGWLHRHSSINNILWRAFTAAGIPSRLEPSGLIGAESRRPDGVTLVPWKVGKCM